MKIFFGCSCARDLFVRKKFFSPQKKRRRYPTAIMRVDICRKRQSIFACKMRAKAVFKYYINRPQLSTINYPDIVRTVFRQRKTYSFTEAALSAERAKISVAAAETQAKYTGESMVAGTKIAAKMHAPFTIGDRIFIVLSLFTAFFDSE